MSAKILAKFGMGLAMGGSVDWACNAIAFESCIWLDSEQKIDLSDVASYCRDACNA